jgi:HEAT repeat protein
VPQGQWVENCRRLAGPALAGGDPALRVAAIRLILRPSLKQEKDLLARIVPMLKDESAEVRKAALVALAGSRDLVGDDDLIVLLHDASEEVQQLCEVALRSRGLQENHILMARLISDERPAARMKVLQHLRGANDLETGVWLRRLCQDPAPAVRAAAVRAAAAQTQVDLRSSLRELSEQDPSPTVRELAGHYLGRLARQVSPD